MAETPQPRVVVVSTSSSFPGIPGESSRGAFALSSGLEALRPPSGVVKEKESILPQVTETENSFSLPFISSPGHETEGRDGAVSTKNGPLVSVPGHTAATAGASPLSASFSQAESKSRGSHSPTAASLPAHVPALSSSAAGSTSPASPTEHPSCRSSSPSQTAAKKRERSPGSAALSSSCGGHSSPPSCSPPLSPSGPAAASPPHSHQHTPQSREIVLMHKLTPEQFQQRLRDLRSRRALIQVFNFRNTVLPSAYCMALFFSAAASAPQLTKLLMYYLEGMPASQFRVLCSGISKCRHLRHVDANATGSSGLSAWRTLLLLKQLRALPDIRHVTLSGNELENRLASRRTYRKKAVGGWRHDRKKGRSDQQHVAGAVSRRKSKREEKENKGEEGEQKEEEKSGEKESKEDGDDSGHRAELCNGAKETASGSEDLSEQEREEEEEEWGRDEEYRVLEDGADNKGVLEGGLLKSKERHKRDGKGVEEVTPLSVRKLLSDEKDGGETLGRSESGAKEEEEEEHHQQQEEDVEEDIEASARVLLREVRESAVTGKRSARQNRKREGSVQREGLVCEEDDGPVSLLQDLLLSGVICLQIKECSLVEQTRLAVWVLNACHLLRLRQLDLGRSDKSLAQTMPGETELLSNDEVS